LPDKKKAFFILTYKEGLFLLTFTQITPVTQVIPLNGAWTWMTDAWIFLKKSLSGCEVIPVRYFEETDGGLLGKRQVSDALDRLRLKG